MKAFICTIALWVIALVGYSQSFSVPMPKGLCSNVPTWPLNHTKKPDNLQLSSTSKTNNNNNSTPAAKPASAVPAIPLIKLWLMTESKDDDN